VKPCDICKKDFEPARKLKAKPRSKWLKEAEAAFNAWVRARDIHRTCIDCGQPFGPSRPGGSMDAGHFRSVGSAPHLRFDERNVHGQRKNCNRPGGATHAAYEAGLALRIGAAAVEALNADQTVQKYTIDDLKIIKKTYRSKLKELKSQL
jgi:hypothetical protein